MNHLLNQTSAYLSAAASQPVHWHPWGEEAFRTAQELDKPILLDIGAAWCHWCHVMDHESYENPVIAEIINSSFVAIKVDRDERPDVDARYQAAVSSITGQGGWPLTAFLLPNGNVFFGGTYFPPEDKYGRPGFPTILRRIAQSFSAERQKVLENAQEVQRILIENLSKKSDQTGLDETSIDYALNAVAHEFDIRNGGFGTAPKFPHPSVIEFLLAAYDSRREPWIMTAVHSTLTAMSRGGVYDQLGGGFHRYSTDEKWIVPHFEKMLYDNAPLLTNYLHAFHATGSQWYADVARDIIRFVDEVLYDSSDGGFYASQDADVAPGDDGSYFTWSERQLKEELSEPEFEVLHRYYHVSGMGEMHADTSQHVLFINTTSDALSKEMSLPEPKVKTLIKNGSAKLRTARARRKTPFVDTRVYASWNGMMISAYFEAARILDDAKPAEQALKSLKRILKRHATREGLISHTEDFALPMLDDQIHTIGALIGAYEYSTERSYLRSAIELMDATIRTFFDESDGTFNDIGEHPQKLGSLTIVYKPINDSPTPGGNPAAASTLLSLAAITGNEDYRRKAERILEYFSGAARTAGIYSATYFHALLDFLHPAPHVAVVGTMNDEKANRLYSAARRAYRPGMTFSRHDISNGKDLPPAVETMMAADAFEGTRAAFLCTNFVCAPPSHNQDELLTAIANFGR